MHRMIRDDVVVDEDGVKIMMFCTACDAHVQFYSSGRSVRCVQALKEYHKKPGRKIVDEELVDVAEVTHTLEWMALCAERQKGCCYMCNEYIRKSRKGDGSRELYAVVVGKSKVLPNTYCYECRSALMRMLDADWGFKADMEIIKEAVSLD